MEDALGKLRQIDFDWIRQIDSVWEPDPFHVEGLHQAVIDSLMDEMNRLGLTTRFESPLGAVVVGYPGSGKTHLLGVMSQALRDKAFFVMVDMTDVTEFWSTVRLGFLDSLYRTLHGKAQYHRVLEHLLSMISGVASPEKTRIGLARLEDPQRLSGYINKILLGPLWEKYPREIQRYRDVLKALFLLNSRIFEVSTTGYSWLQGITLEPEARKQFGFASVESDPTLVVEGLSWAMSLAQPTLLAFDQLDAIVAQHYRATGEIRHVEELQDLEDRIGEHQVSEHILHEVAGGLMDVQGLTFRTLSLVSCLHRTWELLQDRGVRSFSDRYRLPPHTLTPLKSVDLGRRLVRQRVLNSLPGFVPPDKDWPLARGVFNNMPRLMPRELLKLCDASRRKVLAQGHFQRFNPFTVADVSVGQKSVNHDGVADNEEKVVLSGDSEPESGKISLARQHKISVAAEQINLRIDQAYEELQQVADVVSLFSEHKEDTLIDEVLQSVCRCLVWENSQPDKQRIEVDDDFGNSRQSKVLHARLRLVPTNSAEREEHFAFRALQQTNHKAFQSRLTAAIIASGIDERLGFRHLVIVRDTPIPSNHSCERLWQDFKQRGGVHVSPSEDSWRKMYALSELERAVPPGFEDWLYSRKPASGLNLFAESGFSSLIHQDESLAGRESFTGEMDNNDKGNVEDDPIPLLSSDYEGELLLTEQEAEIVHQQPIKTNEADDELILDMDFSSDKPGESTIQLSGSGHGSTPNADEISDFETVELSRDQSDEFELDAHWPIEDGEHPFNEFEGLSLDSHPELRSDHPAADDLEDTPDEDPLARTSLPMSPFNGFMGGQVVRSYAGVDVRRALLIGRRPERSNSRDFVALPVANLDRHTLILGGAGSGKTNLMRRIIEEAVLAGIPSIVLDSSSELACLGQLEMGTDHQESAWPDDGLRAKAYLERLEYRLWTPGFERGRSLNLGYGLNGLAFSHRFDEEEQAISLLVESLRPLVAPRSAPDAAELDLLADVIRFLSSTGKTGLEALISLLHNLPGDLQDNVFHAQEMAAAMASRLESALDIRPELDTREAQVGLNDLLKSKPGKTRVSVVNLMGLASTESRARLLVQLAVSLASWGYGRMEAGSHAEGFRALLVIDDAERLINASPMGLDGLKYLLEHAGLFGIGVVLSTQNPAYLDDNLVSLFGNTLFGRANSHQLMELIQAQIRLKGSIGHDVPWLQRGEFYAHSAGFNESVRIEVPASLSLSGHVMSEKELVELAAVNSSINPEERRGSDVLGIEF